MRHRMFLLAACICLLSLAQKAGAAIVQDSSRAALAGNATVNWNIFGGDGTFLSTPVYQSVGAETVGVASSGGAMSIQKQGGSWSGDFAPGTYVLSQPNISDSFIVNFSGPVAGVGAQIDPATTGPFVAYMDFFNASDVDLGEISVSGTATDAADNSATFIGGSSTGDDISFVTFLLAYNNPQDPDQTRSGQLAINQLDLIEPVPEPSDIGVMGLAIAVLAFIARRRTDDRSMFFHQRRE